MAKKMMSLKLEQETFDRLKMAAVVNKTSMTQIIEVLIDKYLSEFSKEELVDRFFKLERSSRNMDEIVDLLGETVSAVDILSDDTIPIETRDRLYKERMEYINKRLKKMNDANRAQN